MSTWWMSSPDFGVRVVRAELGAAGLELFVPGGENGGREASYCGIRHLLECCPCR